MDGVLIDLLNAKWNTFVKFKFYRQFFTFAFYFLISLVCWTLRPGPPVLKQNSNTTRTLNGTNMTFLGTNTTFIYNLTLLLNDTLKLGNATRFAMNNTEESEVEEWWDNLTEECRLMYLETPQAKIRLSAEIAMVIGAFTYLIAAIREARFLGGRMFFENLVTAKTSYIIKFIFSKIV